MGECINNEVEQIHIMVTVQYYNNWINIYMYMLSRLSVCNAAIWRMGMLGAMFSSSKFDSYKDVKIPNSELSKNFMRSSGPGGQSVNTTNSKA